MQLEVTQVFAGQNIRISGTPENPLFVAKDVCAVLELSNVAQATSGLDADELVSFKMTSGGQMREMLHVTESGIYALIFKSRKLEAKAFRKWVTSEVLPSIRKNGKYEVHEFVIPTTLSGALLLAGELAAKVEEQSAALAIAAPKVAFHDTVTASPSVCQLAVACQLAKLKFGRNILYRKLREMGVLIDGGNRHNLPKQQYVDRGLFQVNESKYNHPKTEEPIITFTTYATQKGIDWLVKTFGGTPVEDCDEPNS
jgi:anti-repressor protein